MNIHKLFNILVNTRNSIPVKSLHADEGHLAVRMPVGVVDRARAFALSKLTELWFLVAKRSETLVGVIARIC